MRDVLRLSHNMKKNNDRYPIVYIVYNTNVYNTVIAFIQNSKILYVAIVSFVNNIL